MIKIATNNINILKLINILAVVKKQKQIKIQSLENACNNYKKD